MSKTETVTAIMALHGLTISGFPESGIDLCHNIRITQNAKRFYEYLSKQGTIFTDMFHFPIGSGVPDYVLERTTTKTYEVGTRSFPGELIISTVKEYKASLAALRVFKPGRIYADHLVLFVGSKAIGYSLIFDKPSLIFNPYMFDASDKDSLKTLHSQILDTTDASLVRSLRWFEKYYNEPELEDELIDIMVAFETLVQTKADEKGDTISIAISMLIGNDMKERKIIRDNLSKSYTLRNKIIHGTDKKIEVSNQSVETVADYFRRSFKALI